MKKLRLELDKLAIESFDVKKEGADARGTVKGNEDCTCYGSCAPYCGASYQWRCSWTGDPRDVCISPW